MNIIKVIVDMLPEYCAECSYREVVTAQIGEKCRFGWHKIDDSLIRPDWCPLVTHNEAFDWMFFESKATQYIVDKLHKEFGLRKESEEK